ncbi:hypothetical protein [Longispora albida]|uniref:hypothetical protein n=1 Tax=Longispora albida TaxID=203523 RepID=UPI00037CAB3F|nr:hypothetical protein [Longispora albida]
MSNLYSGAGAVLCLLAVGLAAILVAGLTRRRRAPDAPPPWSPDPDNPALLDHPPGPEWQQGPQPGELWLADVPYADGVGSSNGPCLVLRTHRDKADVLRIATQGSAPRYVPLGEHGWLDLSGFFRVQDTAFGARAGQCDEETWWTVRRYHETGWVP